MPSDSRLKVLYIAGSGRSGTTLIDIILGQVPGFCPVGEVRQFWEYGLRDNRPCGCGEPLQGCNIWRQVIADLRASGELDWARMSRLRERFARTKRLVPIFLMGRRYARGKDIEEFLRITEILYHSLAKVTESNVIVDSSKWPTYAFLLDQIDSIDLHVLHIVRDPRACAYRWQRKKETDPGKYIETQSALFTTAYWAVWNPAIRGLFRKNEGRYHFLRYEDFVAAPRERIGEILEFAGADKAATPFVDENRVNISPTHSIEGNTARFHSGEIQIRADGDWRDKVSWANRSLVNCMTWPMLIKYGYWPARSFEELDG